MLFSTFIGIINREEFGSDDIPAVLKEVNEVLKLEGKGTYDTTETSKMEDGPKGSNKRTLHDETASMA